MHLFDAEAGVAPFLKKNLTLNKALIKILLTNSTRYSQVYRRANHVTLFVSASQVN